MSSNLSAELAAAVDTFLAEAPSTASANSLAGLIPPTAIDAVCASLAGRGARAHLEALGEATKDKNLKKAARAAAYKLKSAGVAATFKPERRAIDLTPAVELDRIAIVIVPTLGGNTEILVGTLPGAAGGMLDLTSQEQRAEIDASMTAGRLRRIAADAGARRGGRGIPLVNADVAVRAVRAADAYLSELGRSRHGAFAGLLAWAERAEALGADAVRADARLQLQPIPEADDATLLDLMFNHPWSGTPGVPDELGSELDVVLAEELHGQDETDEETFCKRIETLSAQALDTWWAKSGVPQATVRMLELGADVMVALDERDAAALLLTAADRLKSHAGAGSESSLLSGWIGRLVNPRSAWKHRLAHIHGHAHH
jgi:hypothetical protein